MGYITSREGKMLELKKKKFYTARNDKVFKAVMCDEDDLSLLKGFLEHILEVNIHEILLLGTEQKVRYKKERKKMIDALVKVDHKYIHIELNSQNHTYLRNRNFVFFTEIYSKKTKISEDYVRLEDFIHIDLTYGLGKELREREEYQVMNKRGERYVENFKIIEYNMDKIMDIWYSLDEEKIYKYKELIMLDLDELGLEKLGRITGGDKLMEEFREKVEKINEENWFTPWISDEEDDRRILNSEKILSFMEGEEKGKKQNQLETAKKMKEEGIELSIISKITSLPISKIETL